jgi:hypothetical protein
MTATVEAPDQVKVHRALVYCSEDAISVYADKYGWWCMDCTEHRNPDTDGATRTAAARQASRHSQEVQVAM